MRRAQLLLLLGLWVAGERFLAASIGAGCGGETPTGWSDSATRVFDLREPREHSPPRPSPDSGWWRCTLSWQGMA